MAKKNKNDGTAALIVLTLAAFLIFLPFLTITFSRYRKLKKMYKAIPNTQRVYDIGNLFKTIGWAVAMVIVFAGIFIGISFAVEKYVPPEYTKHIALILMSACVLVILWPLKKMAERVAVEYFGVIFNDNDHSMHLPADIDNMGLGETLRLHFLRRLGDQDRVDIKKITNITREKGVNFYIHGDFGSRKIKFTNKQKRDECISALQARTRVRGGRDYGY